MRAVHPLDDTAREGSGFCLRLVHAAIMFSDSGALLEEDVPVQSRPTVWACWRDQCQYLLFVASKFFHDGRGRRCGT
jgi:hypothetical protein